MRPVRLALLAAVVALFTVHLGHYGLLEPDEARYAAVAREMLDSGDWLVPRLNGIVHLTKPPLAYWAAASIFAVAGPTEAAARAGPVVAAMVTLGAVFALGRRLFGEPAAGFAVAALATSPLFFVMGRTLTPDIFLTAGCAVALLGAVAGSRALFWLALAAAFLAKGPVALLVVSGGLVGLGTTAEGRRRLAGLGCWWGPLVFAAIGLAWYAAVAIRTPGVLDYWVGEELVGRVASDVHHRTHPWYFFLPVLALGLLPWSLLLPLAGSPRQEPRVEARRFVLAWLVLPVVGLSLARSKLATYVLPVLPAAALLVGDMLARLPTLPLPRARWAAWLFAALGIGLAVGVLEVGAPGLASVARFVVPDAPIGEELGEVLLPLALGCVAGAIALLRGRAVLARTAWLAGAAAMLLQVAFEMDDVAAAQSLRGVAAVVEHEPAARLVAFHVTRYGPRFYLGRPVIEVGGGRDLRFERDPDAAARLAPSDDSALAAAYAATHEAGGRLFVLARARDAGRVRALVPAPLEVVAEAGDLVLLGAADLTGPGRSGASPVAASAQ